MHSSAWRKAWFQLNHMDGHRVLPYLFDHFDDQRYSLTEDAGPADYNCRLEMRAPTSSSVTCNPTAALRMMAIHLNSIMSGAHPIRSTTSFGLPRTSFGGSLAKTSPFASFRSKPWNG